MTAPSNPHHTSKEEKRLQENERMRLWRLAHKEDDAYRLRRNARERIRSQNKRNDPDFREKERKRNALYRKNNPEKRIATMKKYRDSHKEQIAAYARQYEPQYRNKDEVRARKRAYYGKRYKDNPRNRRAYILKKLYGITPEQWDSLFKFQGDVCAICGSDAPGRARGGWTTDHNHTTMEVRGILCNVCNVMLGHSSDSISRLQRAIAYLQNPPFKAMLAGHEGPKEDADQT